MNSDDFGQFMNEVHGHPPFPWQMKMVEEISSRGSWPALVDVPTGLGKTSMLDVAVFTMAMSVGGEAPGVLGCRRVYMVVDRRVVVDQAAQHGHRIVKALDEAQPGTVAHEVAQRLRSLSDTDADRPALRVVKMRGGVTWDAAWLPRPDLPAIITGTVDQVGSRLFFRGYGVSPRRRPIDAALVGTDSVIMIDEAHLAQAFSASLQAAQSYDTSQVLGRPATSVIHLTATSVRPADGWTATFDEGAHLQHPVAHRRLTAPKTLTFVDSSEKTIVQDMVCRVTELVHPEGLQDPGAEMIPGLELETSSAEVPRVLVTCNTVSRAREVYQALTSGRSKCRDAEVLLLMGRSRALDRENIVARATELFDADREAGGSPAVLVATQTVEVGIDLDATDLVTETASWDALVQRFGRVNRRGAWPRSTVTVIEDCVPVDEKKRKPAVYGASKVNTAEFLRTMSDDHIDVSPLALRHLVVPEGLTAPPPIIPLLLPAQLDAWARTSPAPSNDPPLDPYLHGIDTVLAPITIAWRDGLLDSFDEPVPAGQAGAALDALPVLSEETVELPLGAVRAWLSEGRSPQVSDVEDWDDIPFGDEEQGRASLRRADDGTWQWVPVEALRPGDAIVMPGEYGGLDRFGWNPTSEGPVRDLGELAAARRGRAVLRLDPGLETRLGLPQCEGLMELATALRNAEEPEDRNEIRRRLSDIILMWLIDAEPPAPDSAWTVGDLTVLREAFARGVRITQTEESVESFLRPVTEEADWATGDDDSAAGSSSLHRRVSLAEHLNAVGARAAEIADNVGLSEPLRGTVVDAARWHDLGKVDPRFQAMLLGGSRIAAELAEEPLAKSGMAPGDLAEHRRAHRLSGMPQGARHEAWSEVILAAYIAQCSEGRFRDADLLLHLVASHHGHGRPLLPPVEDQGTHLLKATVDGADVHAPLPMGVSVVAADRFARLNRRYGRWGLALLEAIVRCADMTVSSEGS